ncbi:hypothetical protein IFU01_18060 [Oxalobacteraceae sp. CFBP 8763]|nr:hypothetical protein [Oxalobacteraceae sp. CFBP 8763]
MNTLLLLKVLERMSGRALASVVADISNGSVTERTVRNWIGNCTTPDPDHFERFLAGSREGMRQILKRKEWPPEMSEAFATAMDACPGPLSSFALGLQNGDDLFPAFSGLSHEIDLLEQALTRHRKDDDIHGWVQTMLGAKWLQEEHFMNPDAGADAKATQRQLYEATSWNDLEAPAAVLALHTQLHLLATLDLEFCAAYLSNIEATPIFACLMPRMHPKIGFVNGKSPVLRDAFHYPYRRLLDATACMRVMRESPDRKWPTKVPSAGAMKRWLELAGCYHLAGNLSKWRSGYLFTAGDFEAVWEAWFSFLATGDRPPSPLPMMYAAAVFTTFFVKGSRAGRDLEFIIPDPSIYQHWWDVQRSALTRGSRPLRFGTEKWPPSLM